MSAYTLLSENELRDRLQSGDEHAFTEIYNRYWEKLFSIAYLHSKDKQTAEDIVHEVMMSLWTRKADLEIHSLNAYLATAAKFAVFKSIIRNKRQRTLLSGSHISENISEVEANLDARFLKEYLLGIVEQLPEKTRLVFKYSRIENLRVEEIAQKMKVTPKAVEYHITKVLRILRKKINLFFI